MGLQYDVTRGSAVATAHRLSSCHGEWGWRWWESGCGAGQLLLKYAVERNRATEIKKAYRCYWNNHWDGFMNIWDAWEIGMLEHPQRGN